MRRIVQDDKLGCGVACLAMLVGKSYAELRHAMLPDDKVEATRPQFLRQQLTRLGSRLTPYESCSCGGTIPN